MQEILCFTGILPLLVSCKDKWLKISFIRFGTDAG